jgi:hypothetical protein
MQCVAKGIITLNSRAKKIKTLKTLKRHMLMQGFQNVVELIVIKFWG